MSEEGRIEGREFEGAGGERIFVRTWRPARESGAAVVIAHGVSEHSGRYEHVAADLTRAGHTVHALDHRGHGRSGGRRAMVDRLDAATDDLWAVVGDARVESGTERVFVLAHSMGGAIALAGVTTGRDGIDGLILSGPAVALETAGPAVRAVARSLSAFVPGLGVFAVDAAKVSSDPAAVRDYEQDPLNFHGRIPARTVAELAARIPHIHAGLASVRTPLLVLHGGGDELVPATTGRAVYAGAGSSDKRLVVYEGFAHEILNEPGRDRVLADIRSWLEERNPPAR